MLVINARKANNTPAYQYTYKYLVPKINPKLAQKVQTTTIYVQTNTWFPTTHKRGIQLPWTTKCTTPQVGVSPD